jgi:glycosyltransferase involved in cell wall biosynthesis
MNILLINHYAGSKYHGMEYRPYYLAREWVRMGHAVKILASSESHVRSVNPDLGSQDQLDELIDGINFTWLKTPRYSGNGVGRVWNIFCFIFKVIVRSKKIVNNFKPDLVIASSTYPMDIFPAKYIAKCAKAKLIFEVHDLWPLTLIEVGGMSRRHPFVALIQYSENYAYKHSDIVVSMLPLVREYMESHGMAPSKLKIVQNGIDLSAEVEELDSKLINQLLEIKEQGYSIVGYTGSHGIANALDILLDVAKIMSAEPVKFFMVGNGPEKNRLRARIESEQIKNIFSIDAIPKAQIPSLLTYFDIVYIGWHRQPLYRFGIAPNKLMDYMLAAKPVLHAVDAGNDPVAEAQCGITVPPQDTSAIAEGINKMLRLSKSELNLMGGRGREFVIKNHNYQSLAKSFIESCS